MIPEIVKKETCLLENPQRLDLVGQTLSLPSDSLLDVPIAVASNQKMQGGDVMSQIFFNAFRLFPKIYMPAKKNFKLIINYSLINDEFSINIQTNRQVN